MSLFTGRFGLVLALTLALTTVKAQQQVTTSYKENRIWNTSQRDSVRRIISSMLFYPSWIFQSNKILYTTKASSGLQTFYIADAAKGKNVRLFDGYELAELSASLLPKKLNPMQPNFIVQGVSAKNQGILLCSVEGIAMQYDIRRRRFTIPVMLKEAAQSSSVPRPNLNNFWTLYTRDKVFGVFADNHNLFLSTKSSSGKDSLTQLTYDGEPDYSFARKTLSSQKRNQRGPWLGEWLGDTHIGFALRQDQRKVRSLSLINSLTPGAPERVEYKYELAGDKDVTQYELWLLDADSAKMHQVDISHFPDQEVKLSQGEQTDAIYFTRESRTVDTIQLCRVDPYSRTTTVLITEVGKPVLNDLLQTYAVINDGKEIIWWSERSGKGAYYLYDSKGNLKNAITKGDFVAGNIFHIDTQARYLIIEGFGYKSADNPYHKKFYKINLDGSGFVELTPGQGSHYATLSIDKKYVIDRYSSVDHLPKCEVRDMKGDLRVSIPMPDDSILQAHGLSTPILEKVKAADGLTDLYGVIYRPADLDPNKKYPVICNVYPGPQTDGIPQEFDITPGKNEQLADRGFIVLQFGFRGSSPFRGRDFYNFGHGNLRDYALADCKYVVEQLAERYPSIDLDRVGIYGHSGGGFMTAVAMMTYPDFFKVGVASSGNHDNNIYGKFWTETYQGVEQINTVDSLGRVHATFKSEALTTMQLAKNLKGRLLLVTGDMDNNVHPAHTIRLANALIKNNKKFDLMIIPGAPHEMGGEYYKELIRNYFEEHLRYWKTFDVEMVK